MNKVTASQISLKYGVLIFTVTCILRLAFTIETLPIPAVRTPTPGLDVDLNWQAARLIAGGASADEPYFELMMLSTPLYSYWLALGQKLIGDSMFVHRIINIMIGSLSAVFIFFLMNRLVQSRWIAVICSCMWAMLPSLIYFDSTLHKSALEIFALISILFIASGKRQNASTGYYILKGCIVGILLTVLLLIQLNTFLYAVVVFIYIAFEKEILQKEKIRVLIPAVVIFGTSFLFFQFREEIVNQRYPWFLPTKGVHAHIGSHRGAHGAYHQLDYIRPWPYGHTFDSRLYAETEARHAVTAWEADRFFLRQTLDFIVSSPKETLDLVSTKMLLFFNNYEVKGIDDLYYLKTQSFILAVTPCGLGLFVVFAGLGIVRLVHLKEYRQGFLICGVLGCILASNIVTFVTWRYRLLNIVPLSLLAAHGLRFLHEKTRELFTFHLPVMTRIGTYGVSVILPLALCGWIAYAPVLEGDKKGFFIRSSTNDRLSRKAENRISRLEELESIKTDATWITWEKAFVLSSLHRHSEAYRLLKLLHGKGGSHPYGTYKYVVYLLWLGDYGQAIQLLKDITRQNPELIPAVTRQLRGVEKAAYHLFVAPKLI